MHILALLLAIFVDNKVCDAQHFTTTVAAYWQATIVEKKWKDKSVVNSFMIALACALHYAMKNQNRRCAIGYREQRLLSPSSAASKCACAWRVLNGQTGLKERFFLRSFLWNTIWLAAQF